MYFVTRKQKYYFAFFVASLWTVIDILHKKIGGLLSGAVYSDPHTWPEIAKKYDGTPRWEITIIGGPHTNRIKPV